MKKIGNYINHYLYYSRRIYCDEICREEKQEELFWKKQEARVEKYIRYNVKDVKSITFTKGK